MHEYRPHKKLLLVFSVPLYLCLQQCKNVHPVSQKNDNKEYRTLILVIIRLFYVQHSDTQDQTDTVKRRRTATQHSAHGHPAHIASRLNIQIRQEIYAMHKDSEDIPLRNGEPPRYSQHNDSPPLTGNTSKPSKSIEPWNIIHTANNSYTGIILPRTYDTHQWLPLQFVNYS